MLLPEPVMSNPTSSKPLLHIPYAYIMAASFIFPVFSLISVVTLGVLLHFEKVTSTHCKVPNVVPSISAVTGGVTPERYIWRLGMALFVGPRLFDGLLYVNFFSHSLGAAVSRLWYKWTNGLNYLLYTGQYLALLGLSYISSTENFLLHRNCFISFIVCSMAHMVTFLFLYKAGRQPQSYRDKISFRLRLAFAVAHFTIFFTSIYFYWRHNTYCEPYMYSVYGMCEYLVVLTNVAFHCVQVIELQNDYYITVALPKFTLKHTHRQ